MRYLPVTFLLLLLPLLASCEALFGPRACTLIGCTDGISVRVAELPQSVYTVELLLPDGEVLSMECLRSAAGVCASEVFFDGITPPELAVRLTTASGTRTETFRPTYVSHQPNGPGCSPICRQATITMALPQ